MSQNSSSLSDVFPEYDPQSQLFEIDLLLDQIFTWRNELKGKIAEKEEDMVRERKGSIEYGLALSSRDSMMNGLCYREAACSQAAAATLAPFLEGLFIHMFQFLSKLAAANSKRNSHYRWRLEQVQFWNPKCVSDDGMLSTKDDLFRGTMQLFRSLAIESYFPKDSFTDVVQALFYYRNRALHNGYEWPPDDVHKFVDHVNKHDWNKWFSWTISGGQPWIVSMTDKLASDSVKAARLGFSSFANVADSYGGRV